MRHGCEGRDTTNRDIFSGSLGGDWRYLACVHCVAKTVVLNIRNVSLKMDVYTMKMKIVFRFVSVHLI